MTRWSVLPTPDLTWSTTTYPLITNGPTKTATIPLTQTGDGHPFGGFHP